MGSEVSRNASLQMQLRTKAAFPFAVETHLIRDGEVVLRSEGPDISFSCQTPGVYRVEIHLRGGAPLARDFPWIVSNPIYVREEGH